MYLIKKWEYNGYWCGCCQHVDLWEDEDLRPLESIVEEFPKSYSDWQDKSGPYAVFPIKVEVWNGEKKVAFWEVHEDSYKSKMETLTYFRYRLPGMPKVYEEAFLGRKRERMWNSISSAEKVQRIEYKQKRIKELEKEIEHLENELLNLKRDKE
jgi:hypothetical protein